MRKCIAVGYLRIFTNTSSRAEGFPFEWLLQSAAEVEPKGLPQDFHT
jgi:hypothetical protein